MIDIKNIINRVKGREPRPLDIKKEYAVVLPLINIEGNWQLIYEVRSNSLKRQPGEISFPGGKVEEGEGYKEAAVRETMEELNIDKEKINIIGELDYLVTRDNTIIYSFLATIENIDVNSISPNLDEVDHIFTVPVDFFIENPPKLYYVDLDPVISDDFPYNLIPNGKNYKWRIGKHSVYFYKYKDYIIWGYTARITKHFIDIIKGS
ncbi:MAG: CoA pyrophosphatase [Tissierellia bacterium]|nr:CoA pyrophosphatase [Tissierellia bacterium]